MTRTEFSDITGISKTTFYDRYRWSRRYQRELDMRIREDNGRLTMDEEATRELAGRLMGSRATGSSGRSSNLGEDARPEEC